MQQFGGWYRGFRERLLSSPSSSASSATAPASLDKDSRLPRVGREGVGRGVWGQKEGILETCKLLTAGGVAGAFAKTCTAPLSRLTILYQVQALQSSSGTAAQLTLRNAFSHVIERQGLLSLWKGNGVTVIHRLPYSAINFWAYERLTQVWRQNVCVDETSHGVDFARKLGAGGIAGGLACAAAYPLDLVRTRLSAQINQQYYSGITGTLRTIIRYEGLLSLYRGLGPTLMQTVPSLAINYASYETMRASYMKRHPDQTAPTMGESLACGSFAGWVSSTITFPLDVVRRRLQLNGQRGERLQYKGFTDTIQSIYRKQGLSGFYTGILPEYYKVVPGVAIAFCIYECAKNSLAVQTNKSER